MVGGVAAGLTMCVVGWEVVVVASMFSRQVSVDVHSQHSVSQSYQRLHISLQRGWMGSDVFVVPSSIPKTVSESQEGVVSDGPLA